MAFIEVKDLSIVYRSRRGEEITALEGVDLEIGEGEFVAIVGPSGCGKSTLLKAISGLLRPRRGVVRIGGRVVEGPYDGVGFVFQTPTLLPWRTVLGNILFPIEMKGLRKNDYVEKALKLIEMVGLKGFEKKYPGELSGGMRQRASLIQALIHDPRILLLDEPFGALDALTREELNMELQRIWMREKKTSILVTHSISEAVFQADRVYVMSPRPGRIIHVEEVELPRPRSFEDSSSPEFLKHVNNIRRFIFGQGEKT